MKKIQYSVSLMGNPGHEDDPKKAYGTIQLTIIGILTELSSCIRELLLQGYKIDLGDLGTLTPTIKTKGAVDLKSFTAQNILDLRVNFSKGGALLNLRRDAEFEQTVTRAAQAAALEAQKEGQTCADWTPKTDEDGEEVEP